MTGPVKLFSICLLSLLTLACSRGPVYAPVDSRNNKPVPPATVAKSQPLIPQRSFSTRKATSYVVRRGDTLSSIARRHGMSYKQLARINGIPLPYSIYAGQRLSLTGEAQAVRAPVAEIGAPKPAKAAARPVQKKAASQVKPVKSVKPVKPVTPDSAAEVAFDGTWVWPTRGRLLRGFKPNEPGKKGIFIGGHSEQPVKAAASGKVVYVGSGLVGYGRLIIIRHNKDLLSTYGHNSVLLVDEGEYVKAGQTIAKMGSSGTGRVELYFEIRKEGKPVDPSNYLPKKR